MEPSGFNTVSAISPRGQVIAAYAALQRPEECRIRLYLIELSTGRIMSVPSAAPVFAKTTWSVNGYWLLYQGPGGHLWAYQSISGKVHGSSTPCCQYTAMVAAPSQHGRGKS